MLESDRSSVELLPHDVLELILERLPVKSLLRLKSVSKTWKLAIETPRFQERQLIHRSQSRGPDILFVHFGNHDLKTDDGRLAFSSSIAYTTVCFPTSCKSVCPCICDGLVCLYNRFDPSVNVVVVNPATRWQQRLSLSGTQQTLVDMIKNKVFSSSRPTLGFGKDKLTGTYKPVMLYNSTGFGLDNVTTCEVFDFSIRAWRYGPGSPYRINAGNDPVYLDGSLYWLTECKESKVLSFDLHTETFQVICKAPFTHAHDDPYSVSICILDNCLCVSESINWSTQEIWSLESSGGNVNTWKKMCSIDLTRTVDWCGQCALLAIAILEKNKLLLRGRGYFQPLLIYDLLTKSYELLFKPNRGVTSDCYFQSLFSALPN